MIEQLASVAILLAILYAVGRAIAQMVLAPIHTKLDRLLELQERQGGAGDAES